MDRQFLKILLVDDDEDDYILTKNYLADNEKFDFQIDWEYDFEEALKKIKQNDHDIYIIDYRLGSFSGIDLLVEARRSGCEKPMIMLTGQDSYQADIESMTSGASDYLVKGEINTSMLERAIRYNIERYNNLNTLREQEIKYRLLFEESLDAVFLIDEDMNLLDTNYAFRKLFNILPESSKNLKIENLFKSKERYKEIQNTVAGSGYVINEQVVMKDSENIEKICLISINKMELQDFEKPIMQGIIKDITLLKEAENELRESEKLILTGNMARSVAHEVRNPLTNIIIALKQLDKKTGASSSDEVKEYLNIAYKNAVVINTLIDELLQASNISELKFQPNSLNEIVETAVEFCKDRINLQNVKLDKDLDESLEPINADFDQLKRAFTNVIINAIEAMADSAERTLLIATESINGYYVVQIKDTGKGIEKEKIHELFEPFYTGKPGGMGLGLTSVQNIIKKHNAEIRIKSEPGEGASFEFIFHT